MEEELHQEAGRLGCGMILGKFMPPHRGHQFLIDFARNYVSNLTVLVCTLDREPIPGRLRYEWIRRLCEGDHVRVVHITENLPQEPNESPQFWEIWKRVVRSAVGEKITHVFASEEYGERLAYELDAEFVPVDMNRELRPVCATAIRSSPIKHWEMLPDCVRPYYAKRVAIIGPESTGKSTLSRNLAQHFDTAYVWEYARPLLDRKGGKCEFEDIERIASGQHAAEEAMAQHANRVLICDTNLLLTTVWSHVLFGKCPRWIKDAAKHRRYDLTLLLDVDVPWVDDNQRYFPEADKRLSFMQRCIDTLHEYHHPYVVIRGPWQKRLEQSIAEVEALIRT